MEDEERAEYERLATFMGQVYTNPEAFPVMGESATKIRSIVRKAKGAAQPQSRRNKRKARQEQRQSRQKFLRQHRREFAQAYNEAREKMEAEMREAEEVMRAAEERIATQPKFQIKNVNGQVVLTDVPAEAILNAEGEPAFPQIILPGA